MLQMQEMFKDIWSISKNNSLSDKQYLCTHFDYNLDHESQIGFLGIGWSNRIILTIRYKTDNSEKILIDRTFSINNTEYQNYERFDNIVVHARVSDESGIYPECGYIMQKEIEDQRKRCITEK